MTLMDLNKLKTPLPASVLGIKGIRRHFRGGFEGVQ